jgi:nicotinamidase-related amidase
MTKPLPHNALLPLIDLQKAVDHPDWGTRNNPQAEANVARLLAHWRERRWPVWHVRHNSMEADSHYRPGQPGHDFKPEAMPLSGEPVIAKTTNSAFIGTGLEEKLRAAGHTSLVIAGVITNNSVEATVRMAGNLGFDTYLVADACFTFGRKDWNGVMRSADDVHALSLANLDREYCKVIDTDDAVR